MSGFHHARRAVILRHVHWRAVFQDHARITPQPVLRACAAGMFPMAESADDPDRFRHSLHQRDQASGRSGGQSVGGRPVRPLCPGAGARGNDPATQTSARFPPAGRNLSLQEEIRCAEGCGFCQNHEAEVRHAIAIHIPADQ